MVADDLGLLLVLLGFVTRIAVPERWPLELRDSLLVDCERSICVGRPSNMGS